MPGQRLEDFAAMPALVPELEGVAVAGWQCGEKGLQPFRIEPPVRRQLEEDGPWPVLQRLDRGEEAATLSAGSFSFFIWVM